MQNHGEVRVRGLHMGNITVLPYKLDHFLGIFSDLY